MCGNVSDIPWIIAGGRQVLLAPFLVAGIVNITPDSFSDGGSFLTPAAALVQVQRHVHDGAHMVDLGAESTRPGADDIGHAEEWRRLAPVLQQTIQLRDSGLFSPFHISVDTFRAETARVACLAGADIINDISGTAFDPAMASVIAEFQPGYVLGHSPALSKNMQQNPQYTDVVETLIRHFSEKMNDLVKAGLSEDHISFDPCIGFGKTLAHTASIMQAIPRFRALGRPLYFGVSRKSFLGSLTGAVLSERETLTQVAVALLAAKGVAMHRVHNVAATIATLQLVEFCRAD